VHLGLISSLGPKRLGVSSWISDHFISVSTVSYLLIFVDWMDMFSQETAHPFHIYFLQLTDLLLANLRQVWWPVHVHYWKCKPMCKPLLFPFAKCYWKMTRRWSLKIPFLTLTHFSGA